MVPDLMDWMSWVGSQERFGTEKQIMWKKPEFTEMRFGFEVTMYIYNR